MPFISDNQVAQLREKFASLKGSVKKQKEKMVAQQKAQQGIAIMTSVGAAGAMGFIRGKREDAAGVWNAPFVKFDMELLTAGLLGTVGFFELGGKAASPHLVNAATGIMSHYTGQICRKMAKGEGFTMVAGQPDFGALPTHVGVNPMHVGNDLDPVESALRDAGL